MSIILAKSIPAFIAGLITFLAPCTLPLIPGYLSFISGVSLQDLKDDKNKIRSKVFFNSLFFVLGFSVIFILLGTVFGIFSQALAGARIWLSRIGGIFVIIFGLYMMHVFELPLFDSLNNKLSFNLTDKVKPGSPYSSFIFGVSFAFGWSPCVGPVLGSILILASTTGDVAQGAILLGIFSLGLGLPFLITALLFNKVVGYIQNAAKYLKAVSFIGGVFLLIIGYLLVTDQFAQWNALVFDFMRSLDVEYSKFIYQYL
ncbi:MAG: cytochrome c biogenesis CcdA family protein [Candidatus Magasanikbacteria bacterium]